MSASSLLCWMIMMKKQKETLDKISKCMEEQSKILKDMSEVMQNFSGGIRKKKMVIPSETDSNNEVHW